MSNNNDKNSQKVDDDASTKTKTIVEGSAKMTFPADQESTVFYNPVQVQNRDLSILMMTLYQERRALQRALDTKRKELRGHKNRDQLLQQYEAMLLEKESSSRDEKLQQQTKDDDGLLVLDALAASGLRSIRYWKEIPGIRHITINDLDPAAVERAHHNLQVNGLENVVVVKNNTTTTATTASKQDSSSCRSYGICVQNGDAKHVMYNSRRVPNLQTIDSIQAQLQPQWDVIDLDPYGSAAPFLDAAVQAIANGGLLCITCTDMAALGGSHPETCFGRYASMPIQRAGYLHEMALRILLQAIASSAARYGRTLRPILSVGMDFYVRVFCEIYDDKAGVSALSLKTGHVYQSTQCPSFHIVPSGQMGGKKGTVYKAGRTPPLCEETTGSTAFKVGGPIWLGPLHDDTVVSEALRRLEAAASNDDETTIVPAMKFIATRDRLRGLLTSCRDELQNAPLYYKLPDLAQAVHASTPSLKVMKAALVNAGYDMSGFHKEPQALKTNAPNHVVWDILRAWCKKHPPKKKPPSGSTAEKILAVEPSMEVDFSIPKSLQYKQKGGVTRFPQNPEPHWGPKAKASGHKRKAQDSPDE